MTREEFHNACKRINPAVDEPSLKDYQVIDYVYTHYHTISETEGKAQIAYLYMTHGMAIIHDMYIRAVKNLELERDIMKLKNDLRDLEEKRLRIKSGIDELD